MQFMLQTYKNITVNQLIKKMLSFGKSIFFSRFTQIAIFQWFQPSTAVLLSFSWEYVRLEYRVGLLQ